VPRKRSRPRSSIKHPKHVSYSFDGPLGHYDKAQLQRGFQVFSEVCSACHSLKFVSFRDLADLGYNEAEIKAIAKNWKIKTPDIDPKTGEMATREPVPSDKFPKPFANNVAAAAANNNAIPPDLSLMTKARHSGTAYVYSLLTGYQQQPAELLQKFPDVKTPAGLHYNPYFANLNLAMAPPLTAEGQVTYGEGAAQADRRSDGQGRCGVPDLDGRTEDGEPQERGPRGAAVPPRRDDAGLHVLPEHLGRNQALSLGPDRLKQRGGSARSRPFSCRWLGMPLIPTKVFGGALYACRFLLSC
jgi:hypothetical protein